MRPEARGQRPEVALPNHASHITLSELTEWGEELGRRLTQGSIVTLQGELGTGKTTLVQAICRGVGIAEDVTSPTFALVNEYRSESTTVYHLDLYRLHDAGDLTNIGWDDIVNSGEIVLIEWPERAGNRLPEDAVRICLAYIPDDDNRRLLTAG